MTSSGTAVHPAGGRPGGARRRSPARRRRPAARRRRTSADLGRWLPIALVSLAVLAGLAWDTKATVGPEGCTIAGVPLTDEQLANAATIAEVGRSKGLPDRAIVIALATAQQESRLRNLDHGDRDSLGLFLRSPRALPAVGADGDDSDGGAGGTGTARARLRIGPPAGGNGTRSLRNVPPDAEEVA
jgi:hypothetical protein